MAVEGETCLKIEEKVCKDIISALPEDLLVVILLFVPTKDAVSTALLSKRWRSIWKMVPSLEYSDKDNNENDKSVWWFLDKSLQLHKAPVLEDLTVSLGPTCPVDVDVGRFVIDAVDRCIEWLDFNLEWLAEPISLSKSLYTCKTLRTLYLSNKIFVDVSSQACLPLLEVLDLNSVVYKDEDSLVSLLSGCPVLQRLSVNRHKNDNLINFRVKALPSLQMLKYSNLYRKNNVGEIGRSLIIDSPGLQIVNIIDFSRDLCLIENMPPCFDKALVAMGSNPSDKFLRSLSSAMYLGLTWIHATGRHQSEDLPLSWNQPSSVPGCLSSQLEIFEWNGYKGGIVEKQLLTYILSNSKCLNCRNFPDIHQP